mgnify:CR=1 FL=1
MAFRVTGVNRATGNDMETRILDVESEDEARNIASGMGMIIATCDYVDAPVRHARRDEALSMWIVWLGLVLGALLVLGGVVLAADKGQYGLLLTGLGVLILAQLWAITNYLQRLTAASEAQKRRPAQ